MHKAEEVKELDRKLGAHRRNAGGAPDWWRGDEDAAAQSIALARSLGLRMPRTDG